MTVYLHNICVYGRTACGKIQGFTQALGQNPRATLWRSRDFRLLALGQMAWLLGARFYLVALPWLVLQQTGDVRSLGVVMLLSGIPRVALMVMGGAVTDRFSARVLMLTACLARGGLLAALGGLALSGRLEAWVLYAFGLGYGVVEAFLIPARGALAPSVLPHEQLRAANAVTAGLEQACGLAAPAAAGLLIAGWGGVPAGPGVAFLVDALAMLVCAATFALIPAGAPQTTAPQTTAPQTRLPVSDLLASIQQVVVYVWQHPTLRGLVLMLLAVNVLTSGPLWLGLPWVASSRLAQGAAALGLLTSALGGGALLGGLLAGLGPQSQPTARLIWGLAAGGGMVGLAILSTTSSIFVSVLAVLLVGACLNFINVTAVTGLQSHTPRALLGRVMSLAALK